MTNEPYGGAGPATGTRGTGSARTMSIIGLVLAVVAFLFLPLLGIASIVLGVLAYRQGDRLGIWAAVAGAAALVVGTIIGAMLLANKDK